MGIKFNESELKVVEISHAFRNSNIPVFDYPVSRKEGWKSMADRKPHWLPTGVEFFNFYPDIIPDNRARGFVNDGGITLTDEEKGGKDMFGVEWVYVPVAGGTMEKPGAPHLFSDANEWKEKLTWPDIDAWDWEACAARNKEMLDNGKFNYVVLLNGFGFERLISFMGFEDAAVALIDEDQEDALLELFDKTSDLYCRLVDKICQYFDVDGFFVHDDWGSQRAPFFSFAAGQKFLVPAMKKVVDCIHRNGKVAELHSCGSNALQIENFIAAGWDLWCPMSEINDTEALFQKYGDRIILGVKPEPVDWENDSEETIRAKARKFVEDHCSDPGKVCFVNRYIASTIHDAYGEELYKASREIYQNR